MKVSIIYHSESGNTKSVAETLRNAAAAFPGIEAQTIDVKRPDKGFIDASKVVMFGCPTYAGTISWQLKQYLDTTDCALAGKLGCAFSTENHLGGGADFAELTIIGCLLVRGMIVYSGGAAEAPYTHFGAVTIRAGDETQAARAKMYAGKIIRIAKELFPDS